MTEPSHCIPFPLTWFPPSPWHGYKISRFPPSLFSPASRHESLPTFFTWRHKERDFSEPHKRFKHASTLSGAKMLIPLAWSPPQSPLELLNGNPLWPDILYLSVVRKEPRRGDNDVGAYRAKVEWVEIGHEDLWIHVLQIPGEALALQPLPEVHTLRDVSEGPLWKQFQAAAIKGGGELS